MLALGLLMVCLPQVAEAHPIVVRTEPVDPCVALARPSDEQTSATTCRSGNVLAVAPTSVGITFSEPVTAFGPGLWVVGPDGQRVEQGSVSVDGMRLSIAVAPRLPGTYQVRWAVIGTDTHPARGAFLFSVGHTTPVAASGAEVGDVAPVGLALQAFARALHFVGYALGFGTLAFQLLLLPRPASGQDALLPALRRLVSIGIVAMVLAEPLALLGQTASLGAALILDPTTMGDALDSGFGLAMSYRLGAATLLWVLIGIAEQEHQALTLALVLGGVLAVLDGLAAHAGSVHPLAWGLLVNAVHVVAMGLWVGGLVALLALWRGNGAQASFDRATLVARFGRIAAASVALLVVSGALLAWSHLTAPMDLVHTAYGRLVFAKTAVVLAALACAGWALRQALGRRSRIWSVEATALLVVLTLAGLLVALPPPR